jgi:hypothetical protein
MSLVVKGLQSGWGGRVLLRLPYGDAKVSPEAVGAAAAEAQLQDAMLLHEGNKRRGSV